MACAGSTLEFQPLMVPSSVAKINEAGPDFPASETTNPVVPLKTTPVGAAVNVAPAGGGIVTTSGEPGESGFGKGFPLPRRTDATPVPLSDIQNGPSGAKVMPHGLVRLGLVCRAR